MSTLRAIRKLLLGETLILPVGIASTIALSSVVSQLAGPVLVVGVLLALLVSVMRTARKR